jgi:hypothetical protein
MNSAQSTCIINSKITVVLGLTILLLSWGASTLSFQTGVSFGFSPFFVRNEVKDGLNDWWEYNSNDWFNSTGQSLSSGNESVEMVAARYSSDGTFFNSTVFLSSPFVPKPSSHIPGYGMLIDVDSDNETGWQAKDYMLRVGWDNKTSSWTYRLEEWSTARLTRVVEQVENYTAFFPEDENGSYVNLSLDLRKISLPTQYIVIFFVDYDYSTEDQDYQLTDFSDWIHLPSPKFLMFASEDHLSLNPGDDKVIEIRINSTPPIIGSHINLSVRNTPNITSYFDPSGMEIPQLGVASSDLYVKALENATPKSYTLQLFGQVSFPTQHVAVGDSKVNVTSDNSVLNLNLPLTVDPLTFSEQFTAFWSVYGDALSLVAGGFVAGFAALVFDKFRKRHGEVTNRKNST